MLNITIAELTKIIIMFTRLILILLLCVFYSPVFSAQNNNEPPLTAHSNYDKIITTHGVLAWTENNVFGKYILILNSHHEGDKRTDTLMEGIYDRLKKSGIPVDLSVEYMDINRYPYKQHQDNLEKVFKYKYSNKRINAIITSGKEALDFVLRSHSKQLTSFPGKKIHT